LSFLETLDQQPQAAAARARDALTARRGAQVFLIHWRARALSTSREALQRVPENAKRG